MLWKTAIIPFSVPFKEPARTSRGVYHKRRVRYILIQNDAGAFGIGECAPLEDLSCDAGPEYDQRLIAACRAFSESGSIDAAVPASLPSVRFGLETAMAHAKAGTVRFFDTPFSRGEQGIPINGLIWMGSFDEMLRRLENKLAEGFRCIKIKIGGIDFDQECELLRRIRERYPDPETLELRLDANGSFSPKNALHRLERLAAYRPHSLEQPVRQGQWKIMEKICRESPIPIALDEELIGINTPEERHALISSIKPDYLVLKPSLHGGMSGSAAWIREAQSSGAGYWITSALETNVGLNAIAQWTAAFGSSMPQGLGTGLLFTENISGFPIFIRGSELYCRADGAEPTFSSILSRQNAMIAR